jgi:hypothetical protein
VRWKVIAATALALTGLSLPAPVGASPARHHDPYELGPPGAPLAIAAQAAMPMPSAGGLPRSFSDGLDRLLAAGSIPPAIARADLAAMVAARRSLGKLQGTRRTELAAVIGNLTRIARSGMLTASRLPALVLTLERNRQWWTTGPLLSFAQRIGFPGSLLVWEYYPGQGIEIQWLASFGKANGYFLSGRSENPRLGQLLDELVGLAVARAGGLAWEYDFQFDGGSPPWVSAISQGTAVQALSRGAVRLTRPVYFDVARQALAIFEVPPPLGVRLTTPNGAWYLIYSFAPHQLVLNAFIQSLVGLYDFSTLANDQTGRTLFSDGVAQARIDVPHYDTGAWSLYDQSTESDLGYHELLGGFLRNLCNRIDDPAPSIAGTIASVGTRAARSSAPASATGGSPAPAGGTPTEPASAIPTEPAGGGPTAPAPPPGTNIFCATATNFTIDLRQPPKLSLRTIGRPRAGRPARLILTVSKISNVAIVVVRAGHVTSGLHEQLRRGASTLPWTPAAAGRYTIAASATDLAGNTARTSLGVSVTARRRTHPAHA